MRHTYGNTIFQCNSLHCVALHNIVVDKVILTFKVIARTSVFFEGFGRISY
jgi:hypothetical protein